MKRLVYSPSINVWIKTDTGVFDLSPYITAFNIDRRIGQVSSAEVRFRNPRVDNGKGGTRMLFTEHPDGSGVYPMFHPMDPIIITLTRLKGRPIQVFTGYCDTTPYVQLLPGEATITASCTLKRLLYTFWDPALPFVREFMQKNGWAVTDDGTAFSTENKFGGGLHDGSIGHLLHQVLVEIGGWNDKNIYIQELPGGQVSQIVNKLYKDNAKESASSVKEFDQFLSDLIGSSKYGGAGGSGAGDVGDPTGNGTGYLTSGQVKFRDHLAQLTGLDKGVINAWMLAEESSQAAKTRQSSNNHNWLNIGYFDSGSASFTTSGVWGNPVSAATKTADFLKGKTLGPSTEIKKIILTARGTVSEQIRAIQNSGWASSGYPDLPALYRQYGKV